MQKIRYMTVYIDIFYKIHIISPSHEMKGKYTHLSGGADYVSLLWRELTGQRDRACAGALIMAPDFLV